MVSIEGQADSQYSRQDRQDVWAADRDIRRVLAAVPRLLPLLLLPPGDNEGESGQGES